MKMSSPHRIHPFNLQISISEKRRLVWTTAAKTVAVSLASAFMALLLLASEASGSSFSFSTGNPDGKIATLSRPPSTGNLQTETADDFITTNSIVINQATFTGLIPSGAPLSSIQNVEIEIYHVFPNDSDTNRTLT